jgi:UDP-N-acetylglucosamine--N-acetylmuramyl-(pentapeptide) pyrophosphoryl-undecaprenol N-acetylglucosamine transferase
MASMMGIPTVIQEQNSFPGITNKLLSKRANVICVAYENLERFFPKEKMVFTGNPVRQDLIDVESKRTEAIQHFNLDPKIHNANNVQVFPFIERMDLVYAVSDIIISRAGASSVSELCIVGKPVIFIPSPNVAEDHQTMNAKSIVDKKGGLLLKESELDAEFSLVFEALLKDEGKQNQLSENIKQLAMPEATKTIADEIVKLIQ